MRVLKGEFLQAFAGRIINIHPSLLPSFPGFAGLEAGTGIWCKSDRLHSSLCGRRYRLRSDYWPTDCAGPG